MKKIIKESKKLWMVCVWAALVTACSNTGAQSNAETEASSATAVVQSAAAVGIEQGSIINATDLMTFDEDDYATDWSSDNPVLIQLNGTSAVVEGSGAETKDGSVTITAAGTYVLSGELSEGQIIVDVQDKGNVRLVMNGAVIHDSDNAPIYVKKAGKVIITLQEGTENVVTDGSSYVLEDTSTDEPNAAIFSKADLTFNGTGKLTVEAKYNNGITSKDDLKIMGGTFDIQAADDGIQGRDMVAVADGAITIVAAGDGIKSTNDTDASKGFIAIAGGTFDINADNDGIQAKTTVVIDGGTYTLVTGGGNANGQAKVEGRGQGGPRGISASASSSQTDGTEEESQSAKGVKAGGDIIVNDGTFTIDSADDAVHSNGNIAVTGGEIDITSGDDGIHADSSVTISGGKIDITKSYEGIEGSDITISDGEIHVVSSDDGVNVSTGNDGSSQQLTIHGGYLTVDAAGDGLDANGSIRMTGGTVLVNGPTNGGNGALDYDGTFEISGGYLVAAGSSGMVQASSDSSTQSAVLMSYSQTQQPGTIVHLEDSEGNNVLSFAPSKNYQSVMISTPDLKKGGSYTLYSGGTSTGSEADGLYTDGNYYGGTKVVAFELANNVTWLSESGVTTGRSSSFGGGGGGMRSGGVRPEGGFPEGERPPGERPAGERPAGERPQ